MNLKFTAKIFLAALTVVSLLALGCGNDSSQTQVKRVGMLTMLNASEGDVDKIFISPEQKTTYYNNLTSLEMGLTSGQVDEVRTYRSVANYIAGKTSGVGVKNSQQGADILDSFCLAVKESNLELLNIVNTAIESMQADGTLDKLTQEYITNLKAGEEPPSVDVAEIPGLQTIKVAVTGDLPPLDLIRADGTPAGFNTAIMEEIGRRIGRNVEFVVVDSGARAAALSSGQVDIIFWAIQPGKGNPLPQDADKPEGVFLSEAYYRDMPVDLYNTFAAMQ